MNIYQRINEVRKVVSYARKDKEVQGHGYLAVTHDAVIALIRSALVDQGIVIVPNLEGEPRMIDTGTTTSKGIAFMRYEATFLIEFVNADEPADRIAMRFQSHAIDQGDKAPGKAISYAVKYAILKLFSIETGEDDESRAEQHAKSEKKPIPKASDAPHRPVDGAMDRVESQDRRNLIVDVAKMVNDSMREGKTEEALNTLEEAEFDADEMVAAWSLIPNSKYRAALKELSKSRRA